jgi:hypothetical protein
LDRIHDARELGQLTVARGIDDVPVTLLVERIDYLAV